MTSERLPYFDRLSGLACDTPADGATLPGRWTVTPSSPGSRMNAVPMGSGDYLVGDPSGHWRVALGGGEAREGTLADNVRADPLEALSVCAIDATLGKLMARDESAVAWLRVSPLAPDLGRVNELDELERLLQADFGHLATVCYKPQMHLHVETELLPVSRAKRIPPKAVAYLSAHTEDWAQRRIFDVLPKRILSEVRADNVDIYENRIATRLIDNLCAHLDQHIARLQRLAALVAEKDDFSSRVRGFYKRSERITSLWGEVITATYGNRQIDQTLEKVKALKFQLLALLGSPLYKGVPARATVAITLKQTNILTDDAHYRRIANLWRAWARTGAGERKTLAQLQREAQALHRGFASYCSLVVLRALSDLGYGPVDRATQWGPGASAAFAGHGLTVRVTWAPHGTLRVESGKRCLSVIPLAAQLDARDSTARCEILNQLAAGVHDREDTPALILYLQSQIQGGNDDDKLARAVRTVGNEDTALGRGYGCLPVSPWSITSVEQVMRALRWFLDGVRFDSYPAICNVPPSYWEPLQRQAGAIRWMQLCADRRTVAVTAPSRSGTGPKLNVTAFERDVLQREVRRNVTGRGKGGQRLKQEAEHGASAFVAELGKLRRDLVSLLDCPVCGQVVDEERGFRAHEKDCFECECNSCKTKWGLRRCDKGHRYPFILPGGRFAEVNPTEITPGWVDRVYGSDMLAVPVDAPGRRWAFQCPECCGE